MLSRILRRIRRKPDYQRIAWLERECGLADPSPRVADDYFAKWAITNEPGAIWHVDSPNHVQIIHSRVWDYFENPDAVKAVLLDAEHRSS